MINKRLISLVPSSMRYVIANTLVQWVGLLFNIVFMGLIAWLLTSLYTQSLTASSLMAALGIALILVLCRAVCTLASSRFSYLSSKTVKHTVRQRIFDKLIELGPSYQEHTATSEIVQVAVDGTEQLDTYFGAYLPQFFYAMAAPLTLFAVLCMINWPAALVLLIGVPLIPISIALVQTWAKKLLGKYWGEYTALGDVFLENLQGLTTMKIYQSDGLKHEQMNEQAEKFRKITMKVLTMQLNSITIMDFIAYGGAALGMIVVLFQLQAGHVSLFGALLTILLSADFFLPMRLLGSFFHVAMNGMAASDKIFKLLDLPAPAAATAAFPDHPDLVLDHVNFSYEADQPVLRDVSMTFPYGSFTAIVGESGSGKSTIAALLSGKQTPMAGRILAGSTDLQALDAAALAHSITYVPFSSYLFAGTVKDNLLAAQPSASDEDLWRVLDQVQLSAFLEEEDGLNTWIANGGQNISGGQAQRLALARALLHDTPILILDEATSSIDVYAENAIMELLHTIENKTIILITHRLENVKQADAIYVLDQGTIQESGTHTQLLDQNGPYARLWSAQQELEQYTNGQPVSYSDPLLPSTPALVQPVHSGKGAQDSSWTHPLNHPAEIYTKGGAYEA